MIPSCNVAYSTCRWSGCSVFHSSWSSSPCMLVCTCIALRARSTYLDSCLQRGISAGSLMLGVWCKFECDEECEDLYRGNVSEFFSQKVWMVARKLKSSPGMWDFNNHYNSVASYILFRQRPSLYDRGEQQHAIGCPAELNWPSIDNEYRTGKYRLPIVAVHDRPKRKCNHCMWPT